MRFLMQNWNLRQGIFISTILLTHFGQLSVPSNGGWGKIYPVFVPTKRLPMAHSGCVIVCCKYTHSLLRKFHLDFSHTHAWTLWSPFESERQCSQTARSASTLKTVDILLFTWEISQWWEDLYFIFWPLIKTYVMRAHWKFNIVLEKVLNFAMKVVNFCCDSLRKILFLLTPFQM